MQKQTSKKGTVSWFDFFTRGIVQELELRQMLEPARKAELNSGTIDTDKFQVRGPVYLSTFVLFNFSVFGLYFIFRNKQIRKTIKIGVFLGCFSVVSYKLSVEWINRQFLRSIELKQTDVAYYFRKRLIEEYSDYERVAPRLKRLIQANKHYESIYMI